jgi:hypothetical protein
MSQWVQHISGQGEKWPVTTTDDYGYQVDKKDGKRADFYDLPKSEYCLCEPPEQWVDVTQDCSVKDFPEYSQLMHGHQPVKVQNGQYRFRKVQICEKSTSLQWVFIVERMQP